MIISRRIFLYNRGGRKNHVAGVFPKEESMVSGNIVVSRRTLSSPEAFRIPQRGRP